MQYLNLTIDDIRKALDNKEVTSDELFNEAIKKANYYQKDYNSFVTILDNYEKVESNSILNGVCYALKDNISTKKILTTASSNILKDYVPVYDATVYKKLKESGAVLVGKTVMDELAMGGSGTTGHTGIVRNPWDITRQIGGSSAGSAAAVALGIVPFAIGSDTGDSIRKPASYSGVVGFKPTYGRISRYGLFPFASSLDHLGCFTRCVKDAAYVIDVIKGHDDKDMTSLNDDNKEYSKSLDNDIKGRKLFYIKEALECDDNNSELKEIINNFKQTIEKCRSIGFEVDEISIDNKLLEALYPTYMVISCAEATSNNANLTGISFGPRPLEKNVNDLIFKARTTGFSELIKRRFILGSYILQKENQEKLFLNACRVRRLIVDTINKLFDKYDGYIMPSMSSIAVKFDEKENQVSNKNFAIEHLLLIANFGGMPSISFPCGIVNNMPISINMTSGAKNDELLLNMAYKVEEVLGYKGINRGDDNV